MTTRAATRAPRMTADMPVCTSLRGRPRVPGVARPLGRISGGDCGSFRGKRQAELFSRDIGLGGLEDGAGAVVLHKGDDLEVLEGERAILRRGGGLLVVLIEVLL